MRVQQFIIDQPAVSQIQDGLQALSPNLILVFADKRFFEDQAFMTALAGVCPDALLTGCSTAGEICNDGVHDGTCVITGVRFEQTGLRPASTVLASMDDSTTAGERIGEALAATDLKAVLVFGPGVQINGSALVNGISTRIGSGIPVTGGLAGDGGSFAQTWTVGPQGVSDNAIVAVGLYGDSLRLGHGSFGGWEPFGIARKVTRCEGNTLYELDGEPALEVYKRYLGEHAKGLPASGLLFPFAMLDEDRSAQGLIRTILGINEEDGSLTLAGEILANGYLQLMHASTDRLVNGAEDAADAAIDMLGEESLQLSILVSCVGRKLVMGARVDEEVEAVGDVVGQNTVLTGFYSYGEISPFSAGSACRLHNQTMTVTCLGEA